MSLIIRTRIDPDNETLLRQTFFKISRIHKMDATFGYRKDFNDKAEYCINSKYNNLLILKILLSNFEI